MISYLKGKTNLSKEAVDLLSEKVKIKEYKKGEHLFLNVSTCRDYFFIKKGLARVYCINEGGVENTIWFASQNNFIVTMRDEFVTARYTNSCELMKNSIVSKIKHEDILSLISLNAEIARMAFTSLYMVDGQMVDLLMSLKKPARVKLAELLRAMPDILDVVPAIYVASYLGITPETLSRIR